MYNTFYHRHFYFFKYWQELISSHQLQCKMNSCNRIFVFANVDLKELHKIPLPFQQIISLLWEWCVKLLCIDFLFFIHLAWIDCIKRLFITIYIKLAAVKQYYILFTNNTFNQERQRKMYIMFDKCFIIQYIIISPNKTWQSKKMYKNAAYRMYRMNY